MMEYIIEPQKRLQVCEEVDLCVIGGSCTGLFAAVRAARRCRLLLLGRGCAGAEGRFG